MAILHSNYKKQITDDIIAQLTNNTAQYYAFGSHPISIISIDDNLSWQQSTFISNWSMMFGKKLANTDFCAMIDNIVWQSGTIYTAWDDTVDLNDESFYAIVTAGGGADYLVYKCIDNNNGANSTISPPTSSPQYQTILLNDGYKWRYLYSVSAVTFNKFVPASNTYFPVTSNSSIVANAGLNSTLDVIKIDDAGSGYLQYNTGNLVSIGNSTYFQIQPTAIASPDYYADCALYLYNQAGPTGSQLLTIANSIAIGSQRWVLTTSAANTSQINLASAAYIISPYVDISSDGVIKPTAYCTVNAIGNSINSIVIVDPGSYVTRAMANVIVANNFGSGAVLRPICAPAGGHGSNPMAELYGSGLAIQFKFANTESNTIPTNILYNRVGIMKDPFALNANNTKGSAFYGNTFNQLLIANVNPSTTFTPGDFIKGQTSGAGAIVAFSNSTQIFLAGDKSFANGETIVSGANSTTIDIQSIGDLYTKDMMPIYVQNITDVTRSNTQSETFKVIIDV